MATRLMRHFGKTASGVGLALAVALTIGPGGIQAKHTGGDNDPSRSHLAEQEASPMVSLAATEPLAVVEAWIEGHRIARQDVNLLAADAVLEVAGLPPLTGAADIVAFVDTFYGAIGDREVTVEAVIASGDEVAGLLRVRGTHAGPLLGVPPTGNPVDFLLTAFVEVRDGEIVRIRAVFDAAGLMTQIGTSPAPGLPATRGDIGLQDVMR